MSMHRDALRLLLAAKALAEATEASPIRIDATKAELLGMLRENVLDAAFVFDSTYYDPDDVPTCDYCGMEGHDDWLCPDMPIYHCPTHGEVAAEQTYTDPLGNRCHRCGVPVTDILQGDGGVDLTDEEREALSLPTCSTCGKPIRDDESSVEEGGRERHDGTCE